MTNKALVTALAVSFFALTLSTLPVQANNPTQQCIDTCAQCKDVPPYVDEAARSSGSGDTCKGGPVRYCCTPVPTTKTHDLSPEYEARRACLAKGSSWRYDNATGSCCPSNKVWIEAKKKCDFKEYKQMGRTGIVCAKNDVDIYNSPVEPRNVIGMMNGGTKGTIVERHPDGWVKIQGYGWIASDHFGACP